MGQVSPTPNPQPPTPFLLRRPSHRHPIDLDGRNSHAHGHALPFLAADADAFVETQVVAYHAHILQGLGTVADERGVAHRPRQPAVFDEVALGSRKYEVAARNVHLSAAEIHAIESLRNGPDDIGGLSFPPPREGVGPLAHRGMGGALPA